MKIHADRTRLLRLWGGAALLLLSSLPLTFTAAADAAGSDHKYQVLHSFEGADGAQPYSTVATYGGPRHFVGTTYGGGANGFGTVYEISSHGAFKTLYSFGSGDDGQNPRSYPRLATDSKGNIYGTTTSDGVDGTGTIFRIASDGSETVLHKFDGANDGWQPQGSVILEAKTNNLYGTALNGGPGNLGTAYKLASDGTFTVLQAFGSNNLVYPQNGLIEDAHHNLYGTTSDGGSAGGWGAVFKIAQDGRMTTMYSFFGRDDGGAPYSALVQDAAGNLYGTTDWDGANGGGTIFKVAPNGIETTLHSFSGSVKNEPFPSTLVMDESGNLYGTLASSGTGCEGKGCGFVFELTSAGQFSLLHEFTGGSDGATPFGGVTLVGKYLYGTTTAGGGTGCGGAGCGTVFRLKK